MGLPWFEMEAEGGQDLAGLSAVGGENCLCSRSNPEERCDSPLASGMSWANDNFVDFSGNPLMLPKPGKREERQERYRFKNKGRDYLLQTLLETTVSMRMMLVDQIRNKDSKNGTLPSKRLTFLQKKGEKEMTGIWREGQGQGSTDHRGFKILL